MPSRSLKKPLRKVSSSSNNKKTRTTKPKKSSKMKAVSEVKKTETQTENQTETKTKSKRTKLTKELLWEEFDNFSSDILELIKTVGDKGTKNDTKQNTAKFKTMLKSCLKKVKVIKHKAQRVIKNKPKIQRKNTNSGFKKPVKISRELTKFTKWPKGELKSRIEVTKFLCNYIKENDLQNPKDRRFILPDEKLTKLLNYDENVHEPMTYYRLQTHLKPHFIK